MVSPEIDWWIKNSTRVKKPVYSRKRYAQKDAISANTIQTVLNQDENILLILCTDILVNVCGKANIPCYPAPLRDETRNGELVLSFTEGIGVAFQYNVYISNWYYLVESEAINFSLIPTVGINISASIGYITISSAT